MRAPKRLLTAALLAALALNAQADGNGLRLPDFDAGLLLKGEEGGSGLRLRYLSPAPERHASLDFSTNQEFGSSYGRNSLRADWPVLGEGFRTSLGLDWTLPRTSFNGVQQSSLDITPFLSQGWTTGAREQRGWRLSAEVGTALGGSRYCNPVRCDTTRAQGFDLQGGGGSGLRLNPYVNFGATFVFGE